MGTTVAAGAWDTVRDAGITSSSGPVDAAGQSVAVFTDVVQPERRVTCESRIGEDKKPVPPASLDLVVDDDGNQWHLIGFERNGLDDMAITCKPRDKGSDNATYAYSTVDGFNERAKNGNIIAIVGTVLGIGLAICTFIARRLDQEADDAST
ncbi:hypothetical protein [Aeromicrobium sp.]|uniref:hypothetical protein n=1 Tax=Aeromicrobium sp. TaxID=1871063 RepID=UPI003D6B2BC2